MRTEETEPDKPRRGPRPKPADERRSVQMSVSLKPRGAERFRAACTTANMRQPDALRQAVEQWVKTIEARR